MTVNLKGKNALVTGASSGLGVDFARELAKLGANVILVARREEMLRKVAAEISQQYGVKAEVITLDLSGRDAPQALYDQLKAAGTPVDILVNNAGFGMFGEFVELDWERERNMLELDIITLVHLTKLFVRDMTARSYGYVLHVASIGAYQPSPLYASYSAAKSFVLNFGEALNYELRGTNVKSTVISPGITATEFLKVSGQKPTLYQRLTLMTSESVARIGIKALLRGRPSIVPGLLNAATAWSNRLMPRRMATAIGYLLMKSEKAV
jgi:short-subunit dehydrogenase